MAKWFVAMARNHLFSNLRLYRACSQLTAAEVSATRTSFFPAIDRTLFHIALVDRFYLGALEGCCEGPSVFARHDTPPSLAEIERHQRECDRRLLAVCDALDLEREVVVDRGARGLFPDSAGSVLLHMLQHAVHHRGQVHAMLSGTRVKPPQLDEYFLRDERAAAEDELAAAGFASPHAVRS